MKGTKLKGPVWDHFVVVDPGKNALTSKVKCKYCPWEHLGHPAKIVTPRSALPWLWEKGTPPVR